MTIQEVARSSGFSEPTLRYYERIGLLGEVGRDPASDHRRYGPAAAARIATLSCLRSSGMTVDGMRRYVALVESGDEAAAELAELFGEHAALLAEEIERLRVRQEYLRHKALMWRARSAGDRAAETASVRRIEAILSSL